MKAEDYDENEVLFLYVWRNCQHLLTDFERRVDTAGMVRLKAEHSRSTGHDAFAEMLLKRSGAIGDPEVESALRDGLDAFRRRVGSRLLADPRCQALINRCPRCRRVVVTPKARQCLWCKHDWHDPDV